MSKEFDDFDPEDEVQAEAEAEKADLSPEQYEKLYEELQNFHDSFLSYLAGTANYEVIPTEIDVGEYLQEEHYTSVKKECQKLGAKILYTYKVRKLTVILNPNSLRTVIVQEDEEAH